MALPPRSKPFRKTSEQTDESCREVAETSEREVGDRICSPRKDLRMEPEMTQTALVELLCLIEIAAIPVWLDGGWGVDALLQSQTRTHKDVDIVLPVADVSDLQRLLGTRGFSVREGKPPHSFVLADSSGLEIDVHAVAFDHDGNGVYRMQNDEDWVYPAEGFKGRGLVGGMASPVPIADDSGVMPRARVMFQWRRTFPIWSG